MTTRISTLFLLCAIPIAVAGCAGSEAAKQTSADASVLLKAYQSEATKVLQQQKTIESAITSQTNNVAKESLGVKGGVDAIVASWQVAGDKAALDSFKALRGAKAEDVLKASPILANVDAATSAQPAKLSQDYDPATKALVDLQKYGSAKSRLEFLAGLLKKTADAAKDAGVQLP